MQLAELPRREGGGGEEVLNIFPLKSHQIIRFDFASLGS